MKKCFSGGGELIKICLILPNIKTKKAFENFVRPLYVDNFIYTMVIEKQGNFKFEQVKKIVNQGVDAFIIWNRAYRELSQLYPHIPIFFVHPSAVDLLQYINYYKNKKIGVIGSTELYYDWKNLSRATSIPSINFYPISDMEKNVQIENCIQKAMTDKIDILLGDQDVFHYSQQFPIPFKLVEAGCNTIWQYVCRAVMFFKLNKGCGDCHSEINMKYEDREKRNQHQTVQYTIDDIIGDSLPMLNIKRQASIYAKTDSTILITGESGTGKEMLAQAIHQLSPRKRAPFFAINCGALSESLIESELFGYADGTFTGGIKGGKKGIFEAITGGTLFLDEIGDMNLSMQARLLRVLEDKYVRRLGSCRIIPVDVRIIAATNQDLEKAVEEKRFRLDLYYRLEVLHIYIPPLRLRGNDMCKISNAFLYRFNKMYEKYKKFDPSVLDYFQTLLWPGNVRELANIVERLVLLFSGSVITMNDVKTVIIFQHNKISHGTLKDMARKMISTLEAEGLSITEIAGQLGISRATVYRLKSKSNNTNFR